MPLRGPFHAIAILGCVQTVLSQTLSPTPTLERVEIRADPTVNANIPTFTFHAIDSYLLKNMSPDPNTQPQKDKLEMFPRGIYDDFPQDGVTIAFGPDLKQRIKDAIGDDCKADPEACRKRLAPVIHNTDIGTHSKRFILVSAFLVGAIVKVTVELLVAAAAIGIAWLAAENIPSVKYEYSDLSQMHDMGDSDTFAVQQGPNASPSTITIPNMPDAPTPTENDKITIETLTADAGEMKAGDIVYHLPVDSARRLQDLLGMLGIQDLVNTCKGYDLFRPQNSRLRRADDVQECLRQVGNMIPDLMETIPENAIQLAEQFIPQAPGPGQAIAFPVQNALVDGVHVVAVSYRIIGVRMRAGGAPGPAAPAPGFSMRNFLHSNLGYIVLGYAAMHAGQMVADIWVPKSAVSTDINTDEFICPKDILCIEDECGAQEDDKEISARNAFCKTTKHRGCKCGRINYLDHTQVPQGYMDAQYKWLEELLELATPALSIGMRTVISPHLGSAEVDNSWRFFTTKKGHAVGCDQKSELVQEITPEGPSDPKLPSSVDIDSMPWPGGEFKLKLGGQECYYKNNGQNAGRLFCPDREIACTEDSAKSRGSEKCDGYNFWHAAVFCDL